MYPHGAPSAHVQSPSLSASLPPSQTLAVHLASTEAEADSPVGTAAVETLDHGELLWYPGAVLQTLHLADLSAQ